MILFTENAPQFFEEYFQKNQSENLMAQSLLGRSRFYCPAVDLRGTFIYDNFFKS